MELSKGYSDDVLLQPCCFLCETEFGTYTKNQAFFLSSKRIGNYEYDSLAKERIFNRDVEDGFERNLVRSKGRPVSSSSKIFICSYLEEEYNWTSFKWEVIKLCPFPSLKFLSLKWVNSCMEIKMETDEVFVTALTLHVTEETAFSWRVYSSKSETRKNKQISLVRISGPNLSKKETLKN